MNTQPCKSRVHARTAVARAVKIHGPDSPEAREARTEYRTSKIADQISDAAREIAQLAPEFTPEQRARLSSLLGEIRIVPGGETR